MKSVCNIDRLSNNERSLNVSENNILSLNMNLIIKNNLSWSSFMQGQQIGKADDGRRTIVVSSPSHLFSSHHLVHFYEAYIFQ